MVKVKELLTKEAAANKLKRDRRTVAAALADVPPDDDSGRWPRWKLSTIKAALAAHSERTQPYQRNVHAAEETNGTSTLTEARVQQTQERANLLRLERLEKEAKLVDADQVVRDIERDYSDVRKYLLGFPASVVPELLLCIVSLDEQSRHQTSEAMYDVLKRHVHHALSELKQGKHHPPDGDNTQG